ncbi:NTF2-related export protein [Diaphorina citri]|jgi:Nuclear transport factor 2 (NTF2) domain.|uniref:NTF2-related export protein n=1 Tax=Diaphorina citri TaxID=121845 RepID=A0A1S4EIA0_DIACI|nr:NTF2-related export protein [Diaphorina citri]
MGKLYKDEDAVLSWNGHGTKGSQAIVKYISELPPCDHELKSMDIHRLPEEAAQNQIAYLISTSGTVVYKNMKKTGFNQNFIISAEGARWKIISDVFRLQQTPVNMT